MSYMNRDDFSLTAKRLLISKAALKYARVGLYMISVLEQSIICYMYINQIMYLTLINILIELIFGLLSCMILNTINIIINAFKDLPLFANKH
jgi:hypothetical protein